MTKTHKKTTHIVRPDRDVGRFLAKFNPRTNTFENRLARGEFNNASARRALVDWYLSLFIMCKAGHQYNERPRALALLNLPLVALFAYSSICETLHAKIIYL